MSIESIGNSSPVQKIISNPIQKSIPADAPQAATRGSDRVELSDVSQLLNKLKAGGDIRVDKVADIRAQISAGNYEDDYKLDVTADRLLDDIESK